MNNAASSAPGRQAAERQQARPGHTAGTGTRDGRGGRDPGADGRVFAQAGPRARELAVLCGYLVAGVVLTWPRFTYLTDGRLPATVDQASYVWGFWWVAHQVSHLGNPWFTRYLAAPAGIQLGFDTLMPLPGVLMAPVTLTLGPAVTYNLLTILVPGLASYLMYRAARLWLTAPAGALAAGAFYGLSTMLVWQDWYHLNISLGALFLPLALETTVRLRRSPRPRQAIWAGLALGASVLVNQESAVMAAILACCVLAPWLAREPSVAKLQCTALAVMVTAVLALPQVVAMAAQLAAHGASVSPGVMARWDATFGTPPASLFAPSPRVAVFGLRAVASLFEYPQPREGVPTFGAMLSGLAVLGLVVGWRRRSARLLGLLWAASALLAVGPTLQVGRHSFVPLAEVWHGVQMSMLLPYTWLVQIPGLSSFREADRLALLGLVPAALLAGNAVAWLQRRSRPLLAVALALALLEAGFSGTPQIGVVPAAMPGLDRPIAADHSRSIVVDVPFGLRGGISRYGRPIPVESMVLATADGHPRADSYTSWVPSATIAAMHEHMFFRRLVAAEYGMPSTRSQLRAARRDAAAMRIGWVLAWQHDPVVLGYLRGVGFRFSYRRAGVPVYRFGPTARARARSGRALG